MQRQSLQRDGNHTLHRPSAGLGCKVSSWCIRAAYTSGHMCIKQAQQDDIGGPGEEAPGMGAVPVRTPFQGAISTIFTKHLS